MYLLFLKKKKRKKNKTKMPSSQICITMQIKSIIYMTEAYKTTTTQPSIPTRLNIYTDFLLRKLNREKRIKEICWYKHAAQ